MSQKVSRVALRGKLMAQNNLLRSAKELYIVKRISISNIPSWLLSWFPRRDLYFVRERELQGHRYFSIRNVLAKSSSVGHVPGETCAKSEARTRRTHSKYLEIEKFPARHFFARTPRKAQIEVRIVQTKIEQSRVLHDRQREKSTSTQYATGTWGCDHSNWKMSTLLFSIRRAEEPLVNHEGTLHAQSPWRLTSSSHRYLISNFTIWESQSVTMKTSVLNDALNAINNAEKSGKRQVLIRPSSKVIVKFLSVMQKHGMWATNFVSIRHDN